jgi:lipopolysaccharide transport system ATP-binding protein
MTEPLIKVENVAKKFCRSLKRSLWYGAKDITAELMGRSKSDQLRNDEFWAVSDLSFQVERGQCLGLIGRNGAGKSTLLKMLNGLIKPDKGRIEMRGRVGALIELGAGFNPILTGRENIYNKGAVLGFTKEEINKKFDDIVAFAEIGDFLDMPVQNYSSGMKVRLGFAVSAQMEPDVLLIDEVLAVGDIGFRIKCINRIQELLNECAVIFVSHAMTQVAVVSTDILVMNKGLAALYTREVGKGIEHYYSMFGSGLTQNIGTGKAKLNYIRILKNGLHIIKEEMVLKESDRLIVDLELELDSSINEAAIGIVIFNSEYRPIAETHSINDGFLLRNSGRKNRLTAKFPPLHLNSGKYSLHVNVSDPKAKEWLLRVGNAVNFQAAFRHNCTSDFLLPCEWEQ